MSGKKKVKAIIFDLDDTLMQTSKVRYALVKKIGKEIFNLEITDAMIKQHWGKPMHVFAHDLYGVEDFTAFQPQYLASRAEFPSLPYPDAVGVVNKLLDTFPVGILSSGTRELVFGDLRPHPFPLDRFFAIQTIEETITHKPDPAVFDGVLKRLQTEKGISAAETLYVGDGPHDFHAAHGAGMQFVGLADRTTPKSVFDELGAETIKSLSELLHIL